MEKVAYIIGAGFSAPLGLPVMSNFLEKSKDMYSLNPERYDYFKKVFSQIRDYSVIKNFCQADLFNIEEILSLMEMSNQLQGKKLQHEFLNYICDVIDFYTPSFTRYSDSLPSDWFNFMFGDNETTNVFGFFYGSIHNLIISRNPQIGGNFIYERNPSSNVQYAVISLNYDRVLENLAVFLSDQLELKAEQLTFRMNFDKTSEPFSSQPTLTKLHGCVASRKIIPPTWSKNIHNQILSTWKMAYRIIREATQIRILGYSLPDSDNYIKFLIKSALKESQNLKNIDVICRDSNGAVEKRYGYFICFPKFRFKNCDILDYLEKNSKYTLKPGLCLDKLEKRHEEFMKTDLG